MKVRWGARSEVGMVRKRNEDAFLAEPTLFAVADGMGGHRGGNVASTLALEVVQRSAPTDSNLREAMLDANSEVFRRGNDDRSLQGMGTTLTVLVPGSDTMRLGHVGDSRAYLFREGALRRLTQDHTLVQRWVDEGRLTPEDAERHPQRSILTRSLGVDSDVPIDEMSLEAHAGDRLLLCSDGLTGMVDEARIRDVLQAEADPQAACDQLVELAIESGGDDNVTVIVVDVQETGVAATTTTSAAQTTSAAVTPAAPEPRKRRRMPHAKAWIGAGVLVLVMGLSYTGFRIYLGHQWYVGESDGMVAVYHGIPARPLGVALSHVSARTNIPAAQAEELQPWQALSSGITVDDERQATDLVGQIRSDLGVTAVTGGTTVSPTPGPSPTGTG